MLYSFLAATIIVFWVTMTALLLRKELGPGDTSLRAVPVAHVVKLMLAHEQTSDLQIYNEKLSIGRLQIRPRVRKEDGQRQLEFSGTLHVGLPGTDRQRVGWRAELDLDGRMEMERLKVGASLRDPAPYTVDVLVEPAAHRLTYETRSGLRKIDRSEYTLDENGAREWLRDQGIEPALLMSLHNPKSAPLAVTALQSSLQVRGEKIETYLLSAQQGEQTLLEAHVSQLGQVLRVRTFMGYSAAPDDLMP